MLSAKIVRMTKGLVKKKGPEKKIYIDVVRRYSRAFAERVNASTKYALGTDRTSKEEMQRRQLARLRWAKIRREVRSAIMMAYSSHALSLRDLRNATKIAVERKIFAQSAVTSSETPGQDDFDTRLKEEFGRHVCMRDPPPRISKHAIRQHVQAHFKMKLAMLDRNEDFTNMWVKSIFSASRRLRSSMLTQSRVHQSCPDLTMYKGENICKAKTRNRADSFVARLKKINEDNSSDSDAGLEGSDSDNDDESESGISRKRVRRQSWPSLDNIIWKAQYGNFGI